MVKGPCLGGVGRKFGDNPIQIEMIRNHRRCGQSQEEGSYRNRKKF